MSDTLRWSSLAIEMAVVLANVSPAPVRKGGTALDEIINRHRETEELLPFHPSLRASISHLWPAAKPEIDHLADEKMQRLWGMARTAAAVAVRPYGSGSILALKQAGRRLQRFMRREGLPTFPPADEGDLGEGATAAWERRLSWPNSGLFGQLAATTDPPPFAQTEGEDASDWARRLIDGHWRRWRTVLDCVPALAPVRAVIEEHVLRSLHSHILVVLRTNAEPLALPLPVFPLLVPDRRGEVRYLGALRAIGDNPSSGPGLTVAASFHDQVEAARQRALELWLSTSGRRTTCAGDGNSTADALATASLVVDLRYASRALYSIYPQPVRLEEGSDGVPIALAVLAQLAGVVPDATVVGTGLLLAGASESGGDCRIAWPSSADGRQLQRDTKAKVIAAGLHEIGATVLLPGNTPEAVSEPNAHRVEWLSEAASMSLPEGVGRLGAIGMPELEWEFSGARQPTVRFDDVADSNRARLGASPVACVCADEHGGKSYAIANALVDRAQPERGGAPYRVLFVSLPVGQPSLPADRWSAILCACGVPSAEASRFHAARNWAEKALVFVDCLRRFGPDVLVLDAGWLEWALNAETQERNCYNRSFLPDSFVEILREIVRVLTHLGNRRCASLRERIGDLELVIELRTETAARLIGVSPTELTLPRWLARATDRAFDAFRGAMPPSHVLLLEYLSVMGSEFSVACAGDAPKIGSPKQDALHRMEHSMLFRGPRDSFAVRPNSQWAPTGWEVLGPIVRRGRMSRLHVHPLLRRPALALLRCADRSKGIRDDAGVGDDTVDLARYIYGHVVNFLAPYTDKEPRPLAPLRTKLPDRVLVALNRLGVARRLLEGAFGKSVYSDAGEEKRSPVAKLQEMIRAAERTLLEVQCTPSLGLADTLANRTDELCDLGSAMVEAHLLGHPRPHPGWWELRARLICGPLKDTEWGALCESEVIVRLKEASDCYENALLCLGNSDPDEFRWQRRRINAQRVWFTLKYGRHYPGTAESWARFGPSDIQRIWMCEVDGVTTGGQPPVPAWMRADVAGFLERRGDVAAATAVRTGR